MISKESGFTLIELMIVVAIIAILAAIGLPQYRAYTQRAANTACLAEANAFMHTATSDLSDQRNADPYVAKACVGGPTSVLTPVDWTQNSTVQFQSPTRGTALLVKNVTCHAGTAACAMDP